jgi:pSer/pThr/pTyr-binding forkhead associated (FHA) protein
MTLDALPYTIGRDVTCPLRLNTKKVSRLHAQIHEIEGQFYVTDLHSTNGTFINHERIMQPTPLYYGDVIHIGDHEFRLLESTSQDESTSDVVATMIGLSPLSSRFPTQGKERGKTVNTRFSAPSIPSEFTRVKRKLLAVKNTSKSFTSFRVIIRTITFP